MQIVATSMKYIVFYLRLAFICFASQDAEVSRSSDGHQALDIFDKLLIVFGIPEHYGVLLALWLGVGIHHCAATVAPLCKTRTNKNKKAVQRKGLLILKFQLLLTAAKGCVCFTFHFSHAIISFFFLSPQRYFTGNSA